MTNRLEDMPDYFEHQTLCLSCEQQTKAINQIVCSFCHENELQPQDFEN